ncbi:hypothetical protein DIPPA_30962 [Diplonema papillatum]|nr:hypothetical protein DIPPA_30962 [Diplonema papillatum]
MRSAFRRGSPLRQHTDDSIRLLGQLSDESMARKSRTRLRSASPLREVRLRDIVVRRESVTDKMGLALDDPYLETKVTQVWPGPCHAAGIRPGMIVVAVDGKPANNLLALQHAIAAASFTFTMTVEEPAFTTAGDTSAFLVDAAARVMAHGDQQAAFPARRGSWLARDLADHPPPPPGSILLPTGNFLSAENLARAHPDDISQLHLQLEAANVQVRSAQSRFAAFVDKERELAEELLREREARRAAENEAAVHITRSKQLEVELDVASAELHRLRDLNDALSKQQTGATHTLVTQLEDQVIALRRENDSLLHGRPGGVMSLEVGRREREQQRAFERQVWERERIELDARSQDTSALRTEVDLLLHRSSPARRRPDLALLDFSRQATPLPHPSRNIAPTLPSTTPTPTSTKRTASPGRTYTEGRSTPQFPRSPLSKDSLASAPLRSLFPLSPLTATGAATPSFEKLVREREHNLAPRSPIRSRASPLKLSPRASTKGGVVPDGMLLSQRLASGSISVPHLSRRGFDPGVDRGLAPRRKSVSRSASPDDEIDALGEKVESLKLKTKAVVRQVEDRVKQAERSAAEDDRVDRRVGFANGSPRRSATGETGGSDGSALRRFRIGREQRDRERGNKEKVRSIQREVLDREKDRERDRELRRSQSASEASLSPSRGSPRSLSHSPRSVSEPRGVQREDTAGSSTFTSGTLRRTRDLRKRAEAAFHAIAHRAGGASTVPKQAIPDLLRCGESWAVLFRGLREDDKQAVDTDAWLDWISGIEAKNGLVEAEARLEWVEEQLAGGRSRSGSPSSPFAGQTTRELAAEAKQVERLRSSTKSN